MGVVNGSLKAVLTWQKADQKCLPHYQYQPFPQFLLQNQGRGGLLLELNAIPTGLVRGEVSAEAYWWTDAQFLPYNDGQMLTTATAYLSHPLRAWVRVRNVPAGRIVLHRLQTSTVRSEVLKGSQSTVYPKVQPHPLGEAVSFAGAGELNIVSLRSEPLYTLMRDGNNRAHCFCAISSNGLHLAVLSKSLGFYFLEIFLLDFRLLQHTRAVECHKLCKDFKCSSSHNDHAECKWSPDGSHLALSSSAGLLLLVHKMHVQKVRNVCPDLLHVNLSTAASYDFDPRHRFSRLAIGSVDGQLSLVSADCHDNLSLKAVLHQRATGKTMDCVQYSPDGAALAVSFRNFSVKVYDSTDLTVVHKICMADLCSWLLPRVASGPDPAIMRLSFTNDGCCLATSSCDGKVRVWAVPRLLTLQESCRKAIISRIPVWEIRKWGLPQKMLAFLLQDYV